MHAYQNIPAPTTPSVDEHTEAGGRRPTRVTYLRVNNSRVRACSQACTVVLLSVTSLREQGPSLGARSAGDEHKLDDTG